MITSITSHVPAVLSTDDQLDQSTAKLGEMITAGNFCWLHPSISIGFSVPETCDPQPFRSELVHHEFASLDEASKAVGMHKGTTTQFLQYLIDNQNAGMEFPIAHLASECLHSDGNLYCLYVCKEDGGRKLSLERLGGFWFGRWKLFSARELPLVA